MENPKPTFADLQEAHRKVASLLLVDPVYAEIFLCLKAELIIADKTMDTVERARAVASRLNVAHDVTNLGHDRDQLAPMAVAARAALDCPGLHVLADKGYFSGPQILTCHQAGITTTVPRPETSGNRIKGRYVKADFAYDAREDTHRHV